MTNNSQDMIEKIVFKNFLSLRDVEVTLGKLNVFVGPNASGKSNIAKGLQLIANHVRGESGIFERYASFKEVAYDFDPTQQISLTLETSIEGEKLIYELSLTSEDFIEQVFLQKNQQILTSRGSRPEASVITREGKIHKWNKTYSPLKYFGKGIPHRSALVSLPTVASRRIHQLADILKRIGVYSFSPEKIRSRCNIKENPMLKYLGENLARSLLHLFLENRSAFNAVERAFKATIPEVMEIIPHIEGDAVEIWLKVAGLSEPLKPINISDGSLRLLAHITALYSGNSLVVFEEPENCVHPHLLETLIDLARKAPCQVIITTHSPHLLDHVRPEEVYVVEKPKTETIVKKLSETKELQAVKRLLEQGGTLGEAWYSGLMGGVPEAE